MGVKSKNQLKKQEVKNKQLRRAAKKQYVKDINSLTGSSKIDWEIAEIKRKIQSCNYDLEHGFAGHTGVLHKLSNYKQQLSTKENELKEALRIEEEERIKAEEAKKHSQPLEAPETPQAVDSGPRAFKADQSEVQAAPGVSDPGVPGICTSAVNSSELKKEGEDGGNNSLQ